MGGSKRALLSTIAVFTFVALWHDLSLTLLTWGWLVSFVVIPEVLAGRILPSSKVSSDQASFSSFLFPPSLAFLPPSLLPFHFLDLVLSPWETLTDLLFLFLLLVASHHPVRRPRMVSTRLLRRRCDQRLDHDERQPHWVRDRYSGHEGDVRRDLGELER